MSLRPFRLLPFTLFTALIVAGCGDADPTVPQRINAPSAGPAFSVSGDQAYAIAEGYYERQPLAPFGVSEWEFNENPELVTDQQFDEYGEGRLTDWEAYQIEQDALALEDHVNSCSGSHGGSAGGGGGGGGGENALMSYDRCDDLLRECFKRCKRIRNLKGRAVCYGACFAAYALCRANV